MLDRGSCGVNVTDTLVVFVIMGVCLLLVFGLRALDAEKSVTTVSARPVLTNSVGQHAVEFDTHGEWRVWFTKNQGCEVVSLCEWKNGVLVVYRTVDVKAEREP